MSTPASDHHVYGVIREGQIDNRYRHNLWASCGQFLVYAIGKGGCQPVFVVQRFYEKQVRNEVFDYAGDAYIYCNRRS